MDAAKTISAEARRLYMRAYRNAYKERVRRVAVTLTREEHSSLSRAAASQDVCLAAYLKEAALSRASATAPVPKELLDRLDELVRQVRGIATNVNQMARHSNRLKAGVEDAEVMLKLRLLEGQLRDFVSARAGEGA